jgi:hypothetical protein
MRKLAPLLAAVLLAGAIASSASGARVLPASATPMSTSYTVWVVKWLQAGLQRNSAAPTALLVQNGGKCGFRKGKVWFLPDTGRPVRLTSHCVIPRGTPVLVPVAWLAGPATTKILVDRKNARSYITSASLTVDGASLGRGHFISTPVFYVRFPFRNSSGQPAGLQTAVADGYFAILAPLSPGTHVIVTRSTFGDDEAYGYTYYLTVR